MTADRWIAVAIWGPVLILTALAWLTPGNRPWDRGDE